MSLALIITMGSVAIGSAIVEKILNKLGKTDEASMAGIVSTSMLGTTVVASILTTFAEVRKLGK